MSILDWTVAFSRGNRRTLPFILDRTEDVQDLALELDNIVSRSPRKHADVFRALVNRYEKLTDRQAVEAALKEYFYRYVYRGRKGDVEVLLPYVSTQDLEESLLFFGDTEAIEELPMPEQRKFEMITEELEKRRLAEETPLV